MQIKHFFLACLVIAIIISPVCAASCSFCEFINISKGDTGAAGAAGLAATVDANATFTGPEGTAATVTNIGDTTTAIFDFVIPQGLTGLTGPAGADNMTAGPTGPMGPMNQTANMTAGPAGSAATIAVNATFTGAVGTNADVVNVGSASAASLDFTIPQGMMNLTANMTAGPAGTPGIMNQTANMTAGTAATIAINATFTGAPGTNATVNNTGTSAAASFDFTIPQGLMNQTENQTPGSPGAPGGTGGIILYFNHSASDIATYEGLVKVPAGNAEADETATVKNTLGFVLVDSYATILGEPGLAQLPAGLWQFRSWNYVSATSGTTAIDFKVYNRTAGGTETLLFNVTSADIDATAATLYTTTYAQATPYTISLTDRIVIKVYGRSTHSADVTFHWVYDGSTHTSNVQTPLAVADPTTLTFGAQAAEILKKGQAVYISGAVGENPTVSRANNTVSTQCRVVGLVTTDLASGAIGLVRRGGILTAVDTQATNTYVNPGGETWLAGDLLWSTGTGGLSKTRPTSGRSVKAAFSMLGSDAADVLLAYPFENPVWSTAAAGENIVLRAGDSAGVNKTSFRNYTNSEVAYVDSLGNASFKYIVGLLSGSSGGSVVNKTYVDLKTTSSATHYSYLTLMAGSAMVPTTNPATLGQDETPTGKNNYIMGNFTDGGAENLQWIIDMPADWDSTAATNGKLAFTFLWTAQEGSGDVNWTMSGLVFPDDAAIGTALPEIGYSTDTLTTVGDMHISPDTTAALVTSAGTDGNVAIFKAARNTGSAADTFTGTAQLIGVRVKYIQTKVAA